MRIAIMGSGGIGGYIGARLAQSGEDVTFIARGAHLEALRQHGLRLRSPLGDLDLHHVKAADSPSGVGIADIVLFTVKLYDSETAARVILPMVGPHTRVVTLQNGIDSLDTLARFVPRSQVVAGVTYISGRIEKPGVIVHPGGSTRTTIGGRNDAMVEKFGEACLRAGGVEMQVVEDVDPAIWDKFVILSAFSGGTSLMRCGIGQILGDPESRSFIEQLLAEGMAVAAAAGHPMSDGYQEDAAALWRRLPADTRSSMANDLERGKPIELAWLSGRMHRLGRILGVPTPAHRVVFQALHSFRDGARPSKQAVAATAGESA